MGTATGNTEKIMRLMRWKKRQWAPRQAQRRYLFLTACLQPCGYSTVVVQVREYFLPALIAHHASRAENLSAPSC